MAEEELKKRLNDPGYKNWLKVSRALIESKEALHDFTEKVIVAVHNNIKAKTRLAGLGVSCTSACNMRNRKKPIKCAVCEGWKNEIKTWSGGQLFWKNADPQKWHNTHWEVAKCFMNDQGSKPNATANTGPVTTDLSGMLNVLVNCKEFKLNHLKDKKLPEHVRTVRNNLMHCATMSFTDAEMQGMVNKAIELLEDDKELKHLKICQDKVELIKLLRDNELELKPKEEAACIDTALKSHALAIESGEKIDENMELLYQKLIILIKGNKDLERECGEKIRKIDEKVDGIKQDSDVKFEKVDITLGELKGKVESLLKLANGQGFPSTPTASNSVLGHEIKSFYKNALQSYAQKKKLDLPGYASHQVEGGKFISTVLVDGKEYKSKEPKQSKKEAELSAAEEALRSLGDEDSELSSEDVSECQSTEPQPMGGTSPQQTDKVNYKNLLQEKTQKLKIPNPIYNNEKTDAGFLSSVMYDGDWYMPDIMPQSRKVDAQQKAAQYALAVLKSKEQPELTSSITPPSQLNKASNIEGNGISKGTKDASKPCKAILNEHVQRETKGQLPYYKEEKNSDGKFICKVAVFDKVYESPTSKNSISEAKESAAREACMALNLVGDVHGNSPKSAADLSSGKEPIAVVRSISDEIASGTPQVCSEDDTAILTTGTSSTSPSSVDKPDGKTFKSMLNEYAQKMKANLAWTDVQDENTKQFQSTVTVLGKSFVCVEACSSKKSAQEMAAKEAMKHFNGSATENSSKMNENTSSSFPQDSESVLSGTNKKETIIPGGSSVRSDVKSPRPPGNTSVPSSGIHKSKLEQASCVESVEPQMPTQAQPPPNPKNALQEYVQKQKLDQVIRYASTQDPSTKEFLGKVFVGKRCFKGKHSKAKLKEADKDVARIALDVLEGRSGKPDSKCEQQLKAFHDVHGFSTFPKYEEATCDSDKKFSVQVKVKKKYEFLCKATKSKKKDAEMWLAEEAVKLLEEEKRIAPAQGNAKSRLNLFLQSQDGDSNLNYDVNGDAGKFSGGLSFYAVDVYESLTPQPTKEEAITSAAMSACNAWDLL